MKSNKLKLLQVSTVAVTLASFLSPIASHLRASGWTVDAAASEISDNEICQQSFDQCIEIPFERKLLSSRNVTVAGKADADACLLPVNLIRISPGSPLKLYEYMAHGKPVVTQEDTKGYSDVVSEFSAGICIDFDDHQESGEKIFQFLQNCTVDSQKVKATVKDSCSWEAVMRRCMKAIGQQSE